MFGHALNASYKHVQWQTRIGKGVNQLQRAVLVKTSSHVFAAIPNQVLVARLAARTSHPARAERCDGVGGDNGLQVLD